MKLGVDFSILNQKGTPAFYSDIFANRPTYGFAGRVFISTDTGAIYEDTGTAWTLIADAGAGTTGTLQQVTTNGNTTAQGLVVTAGNVAIGTATAGAPLDIHGTGTIAQFNGTGTSNAYTFYQNAGTNKWRVGNLYNAGANSYEIHDIASAVTRLSIRNTGEFAITGFESINNTPTFASSGNYASNPSLSLTIPVSSTFNSGASWSGMAASSLNTWGGDNTVGNGAVLAGFIGVSRQSFSSGGSTVTLTQGSNGIRAICGMQVLQQTGGSNNSTISHGASLLVQGVYPTAGANITYTNYYGLVINQLDEYGGVTFTNRWGIYQGGSTDKNYFNGNILVKSTTDNGSALQVTGAATISTTITGGGQLSLNSSFGTSTAAISIYNNNAASASNIDLIDFRINNSFGGNERIASIIALNPNATGNNGGRLSFAVSANGTGTTPTNAMNIEQSGNVLINTTTDNGYKLQVNGTGYFSGNLSYNTYGNLQTLYTNIASSTTKTVTITGTLLGTIQIMVSMYGNGSGSSSRAMWMGGGYLQSSLPYTEITRVNGGTTTISAITVNATNTVFTLQNVFAFNTADASISVICNSANQTPVTITIT